MDAAAAKNTSATGNVTRILCACTAAVTADILVTVAQSLAVAVDVVVAVATVTQLLVLFPQAGNFGFHGTHPTLHRRESCVRHGCVCH